MADKLVPSNDDTAAVRRFVDMGDGTFAEKVVVQAADAAVGAAGYPAGATPLNASSGIVANATANASLAGASGKTTYLTGIQISGMGATAAGVAACAVSGLLGSPIQFIIAVPAGVTSGIAPINVTFNPPIPASAPNAPISAAMNAFGAGSAQAIVNMQGFRV